MSPSDGSELGDTVDAVLQPTGEFPISGPGDGQLISGSQYPIIGRTAWPDPDGIFRCAVADISDVPACPANLIAYFTWTDGLGNRQSSQLSTPATLVSSIEAELLSEGIFLSPNGDGQHDTGIARWSAQSEVTATVGLEASGFDDSGPWSRSFTLVDGETLAAGEHEGTLAGTDDAQEIPDGTYDLRVQLSSPGTRGVLLEHKVHIDRTVPGALSGPTGSPTVSGTIDLTWEGRSLSLLEVLEGDTLLGSVEHGSSLSIDTTSLTPGVHEVHPRVTYYVSALDQYVTWTGAPVEIDVRSEEHTSELQSLMRISYA